MPNTNSTSIKPAQRLLKYSSAIGECSAFASAYAKCIVLNTENLKKNDCLKEFTLFKDCVKNALQKK